MKIIALTLSVFAFSYTQVVFAGAIGPWVGNLSPAGSMVYYASGAYNKAMQQMGVGKRWNPDVLASSGLGVSVAQKISLPVGTGVANTTLSGLITPVTVVATIGAVLGSPVVAIASTAILLPGVLDWLLSAGVTRSADKTTLVVGTGDGYPACSSNCSEYQYTTRTAWYKTLYSACQAIGATSGSNYEFTNIHLEGEQCFYDAKPTPTGNAYGTGDYPNSRMNWTARGTTSYPASASTSVVATQAELNRRLSGVAVTPLVVTSMIEAGYSLPLSSVSVTGPAAITGPSTISSTSSTNPAGESITTRTTSTPVSNQTYSNTTNPDTGLLSPTVTSNTTTTTTTIVTNNTTNVSNTTVTTNTSPETSTANELKKQDALTAQDKNLPAAPTLYKQKYPDGLAGVWKTQRDLMVATPLFTLAKGLMPSVAMSGTCPKMPVNLTFSSWANYGVKDVAPPCQVWDWGRAICIVSALLLARRLIFGG